MPIVLRTNKSTPLTFTELDNNFVELDTRVAQIEASYVVRVNSENGDIVLTTADIAENTNLYWTQTRFDTAFAAKTTSSLVEGSNLYWTQIRFDQALQAKSTSNLSEGSNLYFTNARVDARLGAISVNAFGDVDTATTTPNPNEVLTWDGTNWVPAVAPGASGGEANTASNVGAGVGVFQNKVGTDLRFKSLTEGTFITLTSNANDVSVGFAVDANLDVANNKIINLATPTANTDAATKAYVDTAAATKNLISQGNSNVTVTDAGVGSIAMVVDGITRATVNSSGITATLTGNVTGNVTGDVTGDLTGNVTGNVTGNLTGNVVGNVTGDLTGNVIGNVTGSVTGTAGTVTVAAQPAITSVGTLTSLNVSGAATIGSTLTVNGNLTVNGTTTTINSTTLTVADLNIVVASGAASSAAANGAGITVAGANASISWDNLNNRWSSNRDFAAGTFYGNLIGAVTGNASTASVATDIICVANNTNNETVYVTFVDGATGQQGLETDTGLTYNPSTNLLSTTVSSVNCTANNTTNETVYLTFVDGATGSQELETDTNLTYNPSTNVLQTTANTANYADLAERYTADSEYPIGTVVQISSSDKDTEVEAYGGSPFVAGVISDKPAYLMNEQCDGPPVGLVGRVYVRVVGKVSKGKPVFAQLGGTASATGNGPIVGIALHSKESETEELVECILKI